MSGHSTRAVFDVEALYVALDRERRRRRVSAREICRQAGILGPSTWTRIAHGEYPDVENLARLLVWLGDTDIRPYLRTDTESLHG